jgi:hypothetical protein
MSFSLPIAVGVAMGLFARVYYLWRGHRTFPTYPHGLVIHLFLGFIAASLGALAVAALATANLTAGVFLAIGTAQFHTIRDLERGYMAAVDRDLVVPRGSSYVEGMATAFEARNFLVFAVAALATAVAHWWTVWPAIPASVALTMLLAPFVEGPVLRDIAEVEAVPVGVAEGRLIVDGVPVHGLSPEDVPLWRDGLALAVRPKGFRAWQSLKTPGQIQALLHDLTELYGRRDGRDTFWPIGHVDAEARRLLLATVPDREREEGDLEALGYFTIVESSYMWRRRSRSVP